LNNKQTKRTNITRASIQLFRLSAQWQNSSMLEISMNRRTRNSLLINTSDRDINLRRPRLLQKK
jgi:hypothetical protein